MMILSFVGLGSCKKEEKEPDYCSTAWATQIQDELNTAIGAAITYSTNPTTANCNSYKTAMQAYIDALKPFSKCTGWTAEDKADFDESLADAEDELANTNCQ